MKVVIKMNKAMNPNFTDIETEKEIITKLKHIKFEKKGMQYVATLIDEDEYEILKGYGASKMEALDDLHQSLL